MPSQNEMTLKEQRAIQYAKLILGSFSLITFSIWAYNVYSLLRIIAGK